MVEDNHLHDTLKVNENGFVVGNGYTDKFANGHIVQYDVTSYAGDWGVNHVPHVVIVGPSGEIVSEPHVKDTGNTETAIRRVRETATDVLENPDNYLDVPKRNG